MKTKVSLPHFCLHIVSPKLNCFLDFFQKYVIHMPEYKHINKFYLSCFCVCVCVFFFFNIKGVILGYSFGPCFHINISWRYFHTNICMHSCIISFSSYSIRNSAVMNLFDKCCWEYPWGKLHTEGLLGKGYSILHLTDTVKLPSRDVAHSPVLVIIKCLHFSQFYNSFVKWSMLPRCFGL